jgi:preprotein translocase subunit SecA
MFAGSIRRSAQVHPGDASGFKDWCLRTFGFEIPDELAARAVDAAGGTEGVLEVVQEHYARRQEEFGEDLARRVEQYILLNAIDLKWKDHLHAVDALKAGIGLRSYGQVDPKIEYKREGTKLFDDHLIPAIEDDVASKMLRIQVARPAEGETQGESGGLTPRGMVSGGVTTGGPTPAQIDAYKRQMRQQQARQAMRPSVPASSAFDVMRRKQGAAAPEPVKAATSVQAEPDPKFAGAKRNGPCPCGSGKKFKKCHGAAS